MAGECHYVTLVSVVMLVYFNVFQLALALGALIEEPNVDGFPVLVDGMLLGYATRDAVKSAVGEERTSFGANTNVTVRITSAHALRKHDRRGEYNRSRSHFLHICTRAWG
jgi:hypothetical protein